MGQCRETLLHAAEQVVNSASGILPKAEEALRLVQTGFEQGKFNFTDLADTRSEPRTERSWAYRNSCSNEHCPRRELEAAAPVRQTPSKLQPPSKNLTNKQKDNDNTDDFQNSLSAAGGGGGSANRLLQAERIRRPRADDGHGAR